MTTIPFTEELQVAPVGVSEVPDWPLMASVNGTFPPHLSALQSLPEGVSVMDFAAALRKEPEFVQQNLGALA